MKDKKINILLIIVVLLMIIIPTIIPTSSAKIIKVNEETITEIDESLVGKVYKYGTLVDVDSNLVLIYNNVFNEYIAEFLYDSYYQDSSFIGENSMSVNLYDISQYWKIIDLSYASGSPIIILRPVSISNTNKVCNLALLEIGDVCEHDDLIASQYHSRIVYLNKDGDVIDHLSHYYDPVLPSNLYIGYGLSGSLYDTAKIWKLVDVNFGSLSIFYFEPVDSISDGELEFILNCDKETINYKEKNICHFSVKNYKITQDPITLELKGKDDLKIGKITPNEYFKVTNNNNVITITTNYYSDTPESLELFSFEVEAVKANNKDNNIEIENIKYYNNQSYNNIQTTVKIKSNLPLINNPLTKNQKNMLIIILISLLLVGLSKILLKKKGV